MRRTALRAATLFGLLFATTLVAQQPGLYLPQPRVSVVYPTGAQVGTTVEVTVTGTDLDDATSLIFSHPGIKADVIIPPEPPVDPKTKKAPPPKNKKGTPVTSVQFKVTVAANVPLGNHDVRISNTFGVSNPRAFVVGDMKEIVESTKAHNDVPEAQPIEMGTTINGGIANQTDVDYYVFKGKAKDRVLISCLTTSIDSRARPQLELYDSSNKLLGMNRNYKENDALLDVSLPADGDYFIRLSEFAYLAANAEYFYRLSVNTAPWIDNIYPRFVPPGKASKVTLYGRNLPGGKVIEGTTISGRPFEMLEVTITPPADAPRTQMTHRGYISPSRGLLDGFEYSIKGPGGTSNLVPIYYTDIPLVMEQEKGNDKPETAEEVTVPCEIAGRIDKRGDRDWYSFNAKKGDTYYLELFADRIGSEMDTYYVVKNSANMGNVVAEQDDDPDALHPVTFYNRNGDPPSAKFVAPADGKYLVFVGSRESGSYYGPRCVYHMRIRKPQPDFRVVVMPKSRDQPMSPLALQNGEFALDLFADRQDGFNDPITATVENLPPGITAAPAIIGSGSKWGTLVLTGSGSLKEFTGTIRVKCTATINKQPLVREARPATITWAIPANQNIPTIARMDQSLMLAVRSEKAHVRISTDTAKAKVKTKNKDNKDEEIAAQFPLYVKPGDKVTVPLKVSWQGEGARPNVVTVTLEPITANNNTSPITVAPMPIAKDKTEGIITLDIKTTAVPGTYPVVLRGDTAVQFVRDPNKKDAKTNATVSGFAQPMEVIVLPLTLGKFNASISGSIKAGMNGELVVKVDRANDYDGEFTINIVLPKDTKGITVKDVVLPAGVNEVKIPIMVAADAKPGNLQNVIVNAIATVHGKFPIAHDTKFNLNVSAADKKK